MFENIARLQAMGGNFKLLTPPDILHCLRLQQDCRQQGKIYAIEAANELAMFENTGRLQATGGKFKLLKTPVILPCINMIAGQQGEIFKSLTPPVILKCIKIQQDCRQRVNLDD